MLQHMTWTSHITEQVKRMKRENRELTFVNIEATGFQDICDRFAELEKENKFLEKQNRALKLRCGKYSLQITELESEIQDMKFTHKMLNSEEAGRAFARELLGKPMTEDEFIAAGEAEYERTWNIADGDDF